MSGRQSQNEGMPVLPAPGEVTIDGELDDWDLSGRIWVFADKDLRSEYSVKASAMWDENNLYLSARWNDPTPMHNTVNPEFNPSDGWKSDSWQMRVVTDQTIWLTTWFYAPEEKPVLHLSYWQDPNNARAGQDVTLLQAEPAGTRLGEGAEMAYREREDGQGFVQEIKIPWDLLYDEVPDIEAGLVFKLGCEFLWGDPTGKTWPVHRYADNMQPDFTSREFYWTNKSAWGNARLVGDNDIEKRRYISGQARLEGTIPIRLELPKDAARFSLVIEDENGERIRNMGDLDPVEYTVKTDGDTRIVEVPWNGLRDDRWVAEGRKTISKPGKMVEPGTYTTRGLYHDGLGAQYDMCFYNPGNPPWRTGDGTGAWGSNHVSPENVAAAGERMIVGWPFSEGGSALIGVGSDGQKQWGELRGAEELAANQEFVYAIPGHRDPAVLNRFSATDGTYRPFVLDGEEREFDLQLATIFGEEVEGQPAGLAASGDRIALAVKKDEGGGVIGLLDADSAEMLRSFEVPTPTDIALREIDGAIQLYAILDGKISRIDGKTGEINQIDTPGLQSAAALDIDAEGNVVIADTGSDSQVKAYSPDGKLVYTCGQKGGRPIRGEFEPEAMMRMISVAVDPRGHIWVTENWDYPRRVSVWDRDGKLVRDYVGNTGYAGTGCYLHDQDPTLAYVGPIEIELDRSDRSWEVTRILWVPGEDEPFTVSTKSHAQSQRFRSDVSGEMREYMYNNPYRNWQPHVIFMERESGWQPVAAVGRVGFITDKWPDRGRDVVHPEGSLADFDANATFFWNDTNADARIQRDECTIVPAEDGDPAYPLGNWWGSRVSSDLEIFVNGLRRIRPADFTDDGAPIYTPDSAERMGIDERGDHVRATSERLLTLSRKGYSGPTTGLLGIDLEEEEIEWAYPNPFPGVHGSHRAPMPRPGLIIGPLKILGVAEMEDENERVVALRGNLGQDFFMTTDGLFVGTLFRDGRLPSQSLPEKEEQLVGRPLGGFSEGGEPFSGWFGRQDDGTVRMTTSMARTAAMIVDVEGLDTIQRFEGPTVAVDTAELAEAEQANAARAAASEEPKEYAASAISPAPVIDGSSEEWEDIPTLKIERTGSPRQAEARLAYDRENLYVLMTVEDESPWINSGKDPSRLFKTGDAVDVQLHAGKPVQDRTREPVEGDLRIVMAPMQEEEVAVLMAPVAPGADDDATETYTSPIMTKEFDRVEVLNEITLAVEEKSEQYTIEAAIPWAAIGLDIADVQTLEGDVGFISSNADGTENVARTYWSNKDTNLVNDLPSEAWLYPMNWGTIKLEKD
ncbi:MAG: hypothetical protein ACOCSQ_02280 [Planctomycetota bacterium]